MQTDYVQRFLFENLDIRGRLVCLTAAWQRMLDGRDYPEDIAALLGHTTALNVLLGANSTVLPGVIIGDGAVIGAGSLVNRDIPPGAFAAGVPARIIRENYHDGSDNM